jgi:hypothetical protein
MTTALVPYRGKKKLELAKREKQLANLAKARAARGKLSTKAKQVNRAVQKYRKAGLKFFIEAANPICRMLACIPAILGRMADGLEEVTGKKKKKRKKS